jgi:hypothetical protein
MTVGIRWLIVSHERSFRIGHRAGGHHESLRHCRDHVVISYRNAARPSGPLSGTKQGRRRRRGKADLVNRSAFSAT